MPVPAIAPLLQGAYRFAKPAARALGVDTLTNPQTYIRLGQQADDVLRGMLPGAFKGGGFSKVPMNVIGQIEDAARLPIGSNAREAAIGQTTRNLQMLNRVQNAPTPRPVNINASGALRAPVVGGGGQVRAPISVAPQTLKGPQPSYQAFRDIGAPQAIRQIRNMKPGSSLKNTPVKGLAKKLLGAGGIAGAAGTGLDAYLRIQEGQTPVDAIGRSIFGGVTGALAGGAGALLYGEPGDPLSGALAAGSAGYGQGVNAYDQLKSLITGQPASTSYEDMSPLERRELYGGSGDMDAGPDEQERAIAQNERRRIKAEEEEYRSGQPLPDTEEMIDEARSRLPGPSPDNPVQTGVVPPRNTNMPASAEQSYMDPYAYNLAVYGQGRNAAKSQTEMDAVRDLGLAINRAMYPQFNNTKNPTPPLQNMIPESYPQSADGLIEQRGVNLPGSMTNADAQSELLQGSTADDPYQIAARTKVAEALLEQAQIEALRRRFNVNQ